MNAEILVVIDVIKMDRDVLLEVVNEFADELSDADMLQVPIHVTPARTLTALVGAVVRRREAQPF